MGLSEVSSSTYNNPVLNWISSRTKYQSLGLTLLNARSSLIYKRGGNPYNLPAIPKQATTPSRIPSIINMSLLDSSFESGTLVSFKRLKLIFEWGDFARYSKTKGISSSLSLTQNYLNILGRHARSLFSLGLFWVVDNFWGSGTWAFTWDFHLIRVSSLIFLMWRDD